MFRLAHNLRFWPILGALGAAALTAAPARADLIVGIESVTATAGSNGNAFDVFLRNTGPSAVSIAGFGFGLSVGSDISLTDATTSTTLASYIFAGHSVFGPDVATQVGSPLRAADLFDDPTGGISLGAGSTVGLGHVTFDVAAGAAGVYTLSLLPAPDTSLAFQGNDVPIDRFQNGTITAASVPEPAGLVLATAGILCLVAGRLLLANN